MPRSMACFRQTNRWRNAGGQITNPTIASLQQLIEALNAFEGLERGGLAEVAAQADPVMDPVMELRAEPSGDVDAGRIVPLETA